MPCGLDRPTALEAVVFWTSLLEAVVQLAAG
jgi:hypothetical protein